MLFLITFMNTPSNVSPAHKKCTHQVRETTLAIDFQFIMSRCSQCPKCSLSLLHSLIIGDSKIHFAATTPLSPNSIQRSHKNNKNVISGGKFRVLFREYAQTALEGKRDFMYVEKMANHALKCDKYRVKQKLIHEKIKV